MRFQIKKVAPIGTRTGFGFVHRSGGGGCGPEEIVSDEYPASPGGELLRESRVNAGVSFLGLRQAAVRLGLRAEQLSGLETGRYTFDDPSDFETAAKILRGDWPKRADGWPLCPVCNEDELGCVDMSVEEWTAAGRDLAAFMKHELFCHRCARRYPGGTFIAAEVTT